MNPSYMRICLSKQGAMSRFKDWLGLAEIYSPKMLPMIDHIDEACDEHDNWLGIAVSVHESGTWTIFEDMSGALSDISLEKWLEY